MSDRLDPPTLDGLKRMVADVGLDPERFELALEIGDVMAPCPEALVAAAVRIECTVRDIEGWTTREQRAQLAAELALVQMKLDGIEARTKHYESKNERPQRSRARASRQERPAETGPSH